MRYWPATTTVSLLCSTDRYSSCVMTQRGIALHISTWVSRNMSASKQYCPSWAPIHVKSGVSTLQIQSVSPL